MSEAELGRIVERFEAAVHTDDRAELTKVREQLLSLAADQSTEEAFAEPARELASAAQRVAEGDAVGAGECQEQDPFAPAYIVIENGHALWRCQHKPKSHDVPA